MKSSYIINNYNKGAIQKRHSILCHDEAITFEKLSSTSHKMTIDTDNVKPYVSIMNQGTQFAFDVFMREFANILNKSRAI